MKIFGVEILNEGSGVSIDDAVTEMQATFVARLQRPELTLPLRRPCPGRDHYQLWLQSPREPNW